MKSRSTSLAAIISISSLLFGCAEPKPVEPDGQGAQAPSNDNDLAERYPEGKSWRSIALFRVSGEGTTKRHLLEQYSHFARINRYAVSTLVLSNQPINDKHEITLRIDVTSAGVQDLGSSTRLRLRSLSDASPALIILMRELDRTRKMMPYGELLGTAAKLADILDPKLERTLTSIGIFLKSDADGEKVIDSPSIVSGCSFEIDYLTEDGGGVNDVRQVGGKELAADDLQKLSQSIKPLFDYYVFPNMTAKIGEEWTVEGDQFAQLFAFHGDASASGKAILKYAKDGDLNGQRVKELSVQSGRILLDVQGEKNDATYEVDTKGALLKFDAENWLVRHASGPCHVIVRRTSKDHWFLPEDIKRDITTEFIYEAEPTDDAPQR